MQLLPRREGEPIELEPHLHVWKRVEAQHGALGFLYVEHRYLRSRLDVQSTILYLCALQAGEDVQLQEVEDAIQFNGLMRVQEIVEELFEDIFKARPKIELLPGQEQQNGEVTQATPLVSGDSQQSGPSL
jgi:hypothetical protein